ncbi:disintegrin and metalloproteinase domain-containing protein 28 [Platysternon megacephalum]|uniref:Disintegrin and metalloproteinase domain-containing protein 28 n=1 Tax=Platysternon megacephalum TaxID=55544 RepID=A0A4D9EFL1_9SAUR|nr:disintegrin and metalloproteinase domain-containing protein 28 [Platysternon megacephalum]
MEATDVPVGNLIDFDSEPPASVPAESPPSPPQPSSGNGLLGDLGDPAAVGEESDTTESADSENDMGDSPSHHSWNNYRRSSSNESFSSNQSTESAKDEVMVERREFMRQYVEKIFSGGEDLDQEEKAKFGELCSGENRKGREWFARYVSAQRCNSKCVSEQTFYRLVQSFAVVLFECHQMDDFGPAKNLMTMCFTYYHIGKAQVLPSEAKEKPMGSIDSYLKSANSWLAEKKDIAERLLKNTSAKTENVKGFFGGLETKLKGPMGKKSEEGEDRPKEKLQKTVSLHSPEEEEEEKKGEKIYLYMHLKQQPIWHTLRFWNAAFFDAVHCERRKRSPTTREKWCHMTQEERDDSLRFNENITFGQLGTFTHNMLAFGLSKKLCNDFLKKQAVIGNLDEEQNKLLSDHVEQMAAE